MCPRGFKDSLFRGSPSHTVGLEQVQSLRRLFYVDLVAIPRGGLGTKDEFGEYAEVEIFRKESPSHTVGLELCVC